MSPVGGSTSNCTANRYESGAWRWDVRAPITAPLGEPVGPIAAIRIDFIVTPQSNVGLAFDNFDADGTSTCAWPCGSTARSTLAPDPWSCMIAWWKLDEADPLVTCLPACPVRDSVRWHDGETLGPQYPAYEDGMVAGAMRFNGTLDAIQVPHDDQLDFDATESFTIEGWVSGDAEGPMVSKMPGMGYTFGINGNGVPYLQLVDDWLGWAFEADEPLSTNVWSHVAVTLDRLDLSTVVSFYIDGQLANSIQPLGVGTLANTGDLFIGRGPFGGDYFTGALDELTMYNRALTATGIQGIHNAGAAGKCSPNSAMAGDADGFGDSGDPADAIVLRPAFADFVNRPGGNNCAYHGCQSLPFDQLNPPNWEFGYTFMNLPDLESATLEIHFRAGSNAGSGNDTLALQWIDNGDGTWNWGWSRSLADLDAYMGGDGVFSPNEDLVLGVDMFQLPQSDGSTLDLIPMINADGYLDIRLQDDTAINYILLRAKVAPPPIPADLDGDRDADLDDYAIFAGCLGGPEVTTPPPGCDPADFAGADLDGDNDVDLGDVATIYIVIDSF